MFPELQDPSVHHRRRWFYVLWVLLLALAGTGWFLWERPAETGAARVRLTLVVASAPAGTNLRQWAGPLEAMARARGEDLFRSSAEIPFPGRATLPDIPVAIAHRRWTGGLLARRTTGAIAVQFSAPGQAPRYYFYDLRPDLESGFLKAHRTMSLTAAVAWDRLNPDAAALSRVR